MSEPKRYTGKTENSLLGSPHWEHPEGEWVKYEDYAELKAEAERYRLASLRVDVSELHAQFNRALFDDTIAENARLKAEVERLTKAGDEMAGLIQAIYEGEFSGRCEWKELEDWNAAKEGKPHA